MPANLVYNKSVIECLLHCLLNIPRNIGDAFFYVITCVYTSWKTVVLLFLFHVLDCNAIFANQNLLPTLRPGHFDLHTKMPGSAPAWAVVHKCPICADLLLVGRRSERLCRRLVPSNLCVNRSVDCALAICLKGSHMSIRTICAGLFVLTPVSRTMSDNFSVSRHRLGNTCEWCFLIVSSKFVSNKSPLCLTYNCAKVPH